MHIQRHPEIQRCVVEEAFQPGPPAEETLISGKALGVFFVVPGEDRLPLNILACHLSL